MSRWNFAPLETPVGLLHCCNLCQLAASIVRHAIFLESIQTIKCIDQGEFKDASNHGVIFVKSKPVDKGNGKYSVLFNFLYRMCQKEQLQTGQQDTLRAMKDLIARYPALDIHSTYTQCSVSMEGDVIECIIYTCRFTGPAVDEEVKKAREQMHNSIKQFIDELDDLERILFNHNGSGPPRNYERPDPYWFVKACVLAVCIKKTEGLNGRGFQQTSSVQCRTCKSVTVTFVQNLL